MSHHFDRAAKLLQKISEHWNRFTMCGNAITTVVVAVCNPRKNWKRVTHVCLLITPPTPHFCDIQVPGTATVCHAHGAMIARQTGTWCTRKQQLQLLSRGYMEQHCAWVPKALGFKASRQQPSKHSSTTAFLLTGSIYMLNF